jgi:mRNA-degrading endonuclease RelE of RelBE toxin-antitoxin system
VGVRIVKEIDKKLEKLSKNYPEYIKRKVIKVLHAI